MSSWRDNETGRVVLAEEVIQAFRYGEQDFEVGDFILWCPPYLELKKREAWLAACTKVAD